MFIDNNWYGNRFIISRYCRLKDKVALASIQHGLIVPKIGKKYYERTFQCFPWLVWNKEFKKNAEKYNQRNIVSIGAPFIYLNKILKNKKTKPKGTLIIPSKSSPESEQFVDYEKLISFVKKKFNKPYTILIGYEDLKTIYKIRHNFKDCRFFTCGNRSNKFFTDNLYNVINKHHTVSIFYVGSPILYSLFLKKKTYFFFNRFYKDVGGKKNIKEKLVRTSHKNHVKIILEEDKDLVNLMEKNYNLNFNNLNTITNQKNAAIALGYDSLKKRNELINLLGWNNKLKYLIGCILNIIMKLKYNDNR